MLTGEEASIRIPRHSISSHTVRSGSAPCLLKTKTDETRMQNVAKTIAVLTSVG